MCLRNLPYSQKIWRGIKFGGLAVCLVTAKFKIRQYFILAYIRMAIPYRIAKFKSANIFAIAIWGPTAKFNSRQYFQLYGMRICQNGPLDKFMQFLFMRSSALCILYPRERGPMGGAPYIRPRLGDGPIFEVSVLHLDAKERPGKLPTLSS